MTARIAWLLLFAFPLFIVSVRHWASGIYIFLCLLAIPSSRRGWEVLGREGRVFLAVIVAYLASAVISNTMSGWTDASVHWYQADVRFIFAIPLFLFFRAYPNCVVSLLQGVPIAGSYVGMHAIYETFAGSGRVDGPYGPIFFGDIAALLTVLSLASLRVETYRNRARVPLHILGSFLGLVAVVLSGTRNAWLATAFALPLAALFALQGLPNGRRRFLVGFLAATLAGVAFGITEAPKLTRERFHAALEQLTSYSEADSPEEQDRLAATSVGFRLEQWRVALMIFQERPLVGYGVGNVGKEINRYVESGQASPVLYSKTAQSGRPIHLHSAYMDALTQKGLLGLFALLAVLLCPVYFAVRFRRQAPRSFGLALVNALAFVIFSLTEDPFVRNNFSSVYVVFTFALVTLLLAEARKAKNTAEPSIRES